MDYGLRIIYDAKTGKVLNGALHECTGHQDGLRPQEIAFLDLPYGYNDNNFKEAIEYHIDVTKDVTAPISERIVITKWMEHIPTYEELENQLLLQEDERVGGIL